MPIKIEEEQLDRKITELGTDDLLNAYAEVYKILNINALEKMAKKSQEEKSRS